MIRWARSGSLAACEQSSCTSDAAIYQPVLVPQASRCQAKRRLGTKASAQASVTAEMSRCPMSRLAFQPGPEAGVTPASLPPATNFSSQHYDYAPFQSPTYQVQPYRLPCRRKLAGLRYGTGGNGMLMAQLRLKKVM